MSNRNMAKWLTVVLFWISTAVVCGNTLALLELLTKLGFSSDSHFNAAIGARVSVSPSELASCSEGNHCVRPWWYSSGFSGSNVFFPAQMMTDPPHIACNGISLTCDHRCPTTQYSTPIGQPLQFDYDRCNEDGNSTHVPAMETKYPILVNTAGPCSPSLNFVNNFSQTAGFQFHFSLNFELMRLYNDTQFMLLEGKLATPMDTDRTSLSNDEKFFWAIEKNITGSFHLSMYVVSSAHFTITPRQVYKSPESYDSANSDVKLFLRHIHKPGGSSCFYLNGLKVSCLRHPLTHSRYLKFISLNYPNHFNLRPMTGVVVGAALYELDQPQTVISESEILKLQGVISSKPVQCLCQSTGYPFMKRADWQAFSDHPSVYSKYCFAGESVTSTKTLRNNVDHHGIMDAFDGDLSTAWLTSADVQNITINVSFPHDVKVKAVALALSVLPANISVYSEQEEFIGSVQTQCEVTDKSCATWRDIVTDVDISQKKVPQLTWLLPNQVTTKKLIFVFEGKQESGADALLINDIAIVATCRCAGTARCISANQAQPTDASINHRCECPEDITGVHCDQCRAGMYTTNHGGLVNHPSLCKDCRCDPMGTCHMINSTSCSNVRTDTCRNDGQCLCRSGDDTHYDKTNPKCTANILTISPNYGPKSGGTRITITGKYISAYDQIRLTDTQRNFNIIRDATTVSVEERGVEKLVATTPPANSHFKQFTTELVGSTESNNDFVFNYRPNPVIHNFENRDVSVKSGFLVTAEGENLDASSQPVMITYLSCATSGILHDALVTNCTGNKTVLTCITPDLLESLSTMRCVVTRRLRRAVAPITVQRDLETDYTGLYVEFGFIFDGFTEYKLINNSVKGSLFNDPIISNLTSKQSQLAALAESLIVSGKHLIRCCTTEDYKLRVGGEPCPIKHLANDKIVCQLPDSWRHSGPDATRDVMVKMGERPWTYIGTVSKIEATSIWDDKRFVLTVAISCTLTFVTAMIVASVVCCIYHRHFFDDPKEAKESEQEAYSAPKPPATTEQTTIDVEQKPQTEDDYQLKPEHFVNDVNATQEDQTPHDISTELPIDLESAELEDLETADKPLSQVCYVTEECPGNYNNKGYHECETN